MKLRSIVSLLTTLMCLQAAAQEVPDCPQDTYAGIYLGRFTLAGYYSQVEVGRFGALVTPERKVYVIGYHSGEGDYEMFTLNSAGAWDYDINADWHTSGFIDPSQTYGAALSGTVERRNPTGSPDDVYVGEGDLWVPGQWTEPPYAGAAGLYTGSYSWQGQANKLQAILSPDGDLYVSAYSPNGRSFDGGYALVEADGSFSLTTVQLRVTITGRVDPSALRIEGNIVQGDGKYTMSRTSFVYSAPTITVQPQNLAVTAGATGTMTVQAAGSEVLKYQWYENGVALAGATQAKLVLANIQSTANGNAYSVTVENCYGQASSTPAVVSVVPEMLKPTLTITSPKNAQRWTAETIAITGTAADNVRVATVYYQVNGGEFTPAQGTTQWTGTAASLVPGSNVVRAYAVDSSGNRSEFVSVTFTYVQMSTLTVIIYGSGTVSPLLGGKSLEVGTLQTLTAKPAAGYIFDRWSGGQVSSLPVLKFTMTPGLVLQANFIPNPFLPLAGNYNGLVGQESDTFVHETSGSFTLTVTPKGTYTGAIIVGGSRYSISGQFDSQGRASKSIPRRNMAPLSLDLLLDLAQPDAPLTGSLSDGTWTAQLRGYRAYYDGKTRVAPQAGAYTLLLPGDCEVPGAPCGHSYATISVSKAGMVQLAGVLADSTKVTKKLALSQTGLWPVHIPLYGGKGDLIGELQFAEQSVNANQSGLVWFKPAGTGTKYHAGGFTFSLAPEGSSYLRPAAGNGILNITAGELRLTGGSFNSESVKSLAIDANNRVTSAEKLSITFNTSSGLFSGSALDSVTAKVIKFNGVVLQNQNIAAGFFLGTDNSGQAVIVAKP